MEDRVAQSVQRLATGWTVGGSNPGGGARFSAPVQTDPGAHPASWTMGTRSFPGVKSGRGVTLTSHPLLVPWSRKSRAIPLIPLWALRPVQSLSACTRAHFTFTFTFTCDAWALLGAKFQSPAFVFLRNAPFVMTFVLQFWLLLTVLHYYIQEYQVFGVVRQFWTG